jgi:hypothetical protein
MLSKKIFFISLSFVLILFSCKKVELNRINKITTDSVIVLNTTVNASGTIIDISKEGITKFGHCWSTIENPTINDFKLEFENAVAGKEFTSAISNLSANTTYYICAYATNVNETIYGEIKKFTISSFSTVSIVSSQLQIQNETTLSVNGSISNLGSLNAVDYGHCWATHSSPTIIDNKTSYGLLSSSINFSSSLSSLNLETTYYVRTYLKLDNNTVIYSNELSTLIPDLVVTTDNFSISVTTATLEGTLVNLGVLPVIDYGQCWSSVTSNPNVNDNVISKGTATSTGVYYANLTGLISGTTYYYRAYARKGSTLKYGIVKSFSF